MVSLTIRNLAKALKLRPRIRTAGHGRPMEEEAREILRSAVGVPATPANLAASICGWWGSGYPPREPVCEPPVLE